MVALTAGLTAQAAAPVGLGMARSFAVLAGSTITNTGPTTITGNVRLHPGTAVTQRQGLANDQQGASHFHIYAAQLASNVNQLESGVDDYMLSGAPDALLRYQQASGQIDSIAAQFETEASELPGLQGAVSGVTSATAAWQKTYGQPAIDAVQAGGGDRLLPFAQGGTEDEVPLHAALSAVISQLSQVDQDLAARQDALSTGRSLGTGFGVLVMLGALAAALWVIRRYGRALECDAMNAGILNRFTEVTSFASDDTAVAASNLEALSLLVHPDASVTHVLNRSKDRAVPEAIAGSADAQVLTMHALSSCAGVIRGSVYVADDIGAPLSVHCPVYPAEAGTLACVPLIAGELIGSVHLYWDKPRALPLTLQSSVVRIAEHAALAIANRRLLAVLQGQASTDQRTGLANGRAFDDAVEQALSDRGSSEATSVLMLDLDRFKDFNDRYGHPAGDEALRTFAGVLGSCMRDNDLAARYGGEEFTVLLPGVGREGARGIAERIRARTESTIISLAPGLSARLTVSIGVAVAPDQALDRVGLLRAADEALYRAKARGRNCVEDAGEPMEPAAALAVAAV